MNQNKKQTDTKTMSSPSSKGVDSSSKQSRPTTADSDVRRDATSRTSGRDDIKKTSHLK